MRQRRVDRHHDVEFADQRRGLGEVGLQRTKVDQPRRGERRLIGRLNVALKVDEGRARHVHDGAQTFERDRAHRVVCVLRIARPRDPDAQARHLRRDPAAPRVDEFGRRREIGHLRGNTVQRQLERARRRHQRAGQMKLRRRAFRRHDMNVGPDRLQQRARGQGRSQARRSRPCP